MLPFPSAVKLPTRAMNAPKFTPESATVSENAYVPFKSALENPPVTGGGTLGALLLLHAVAKRAATAARTTASGFIGHPLRTCPLYLRAAAGSRAYSAAPRSGS